MFPILWTRGICGYSSSRILASVPDLTAGYSPDEIYNMDETALFYRMESDRGLATKRLEGRKKDKERLTVVACTNANGTDKVPLWIIGKFASPRCFKNVNLANIGCHYRNSKRAWMDNYLFREWLAWFYRHLNGKKAILFLDNCLAHKAFDEELFPNLKIVFLPPNTTSKVQLWISKRSSKVQYVRCCCTRKFKTL